MSIDAYEESEEYRETEEERRMHDERFVEKFFTERELIVDFDDETEEERRMRDERFVEKFFTERELIVDFDDTSESHEEKAQAWYEAVEKTIRTLPIYQHDNMGQPLNITDTTNGDGVDSDKADNKSTTSDTKSQAWFFRGQKDAKFGFTSTLYRRLLNSNPSQPPTTNPQNLPYHEEITQHFEDRIALEKSMIKAEVNLLNKAREIGIGRGLTALEKLTLLQHHGSPTRLIDVTSDWKVALFFACENDDDRDGRIFLINTNLLKWKTFPKEESEVNRSEQLIWQDMIERWTNLDKLLLENTAFSSFWSTITWPILLPFSDPRMISQRGYFLTGGIPSGMGDAKFYTSRCTKCNKNRCKCSGSIILPRSIKHLQKADRPTYYPLNTEEFRMITSLPIDFRNDRLFFHEIKELKTPQRNAAGYSIRVPKHYKRKLREILRTGGVHTDSIYPPLRETVRLFEHVVDESLKQ